MVANGIKRTGRDKKETAKIEVDRWAYAFTIVKLYLIPQTYYKQTTGEISPEQTGVHTLQASLYLPQELHVDPTIPVLVEFRKQLSYL
jgi:hypothetical protein